MAFWCSTEVDIVEHDLRDGKTREQIAQHLCACGYPRSVSSVKDKVAAMGWHGPTVDYVRIAVFNAWPEERIETLRKLWDRGLSCSAIGGEMGMTRNAIIGKACRLGLPARQKRGDERKKYIQRSAEERAKHKRPPRDRKGEYRPRLPVEPLPAPIQDQNIPLEQRKTLFELTNSTCRWPIDSLGYPSFYFCGAPGADHAKGHPYCSGHAARAFHYSKKSNLKFVAEREARFERSKITFLHAEGRHEP
jgi:GcrA cell cycle regulator